MKNYKHFGYWWANSSIELVKIDGRIFALNGWDGESYRLCWECQNCDHIDGLMTVKDKTADYEIRPVYLYELNNIDLSLIKKDSDEWEAVHEIMQYIVTRC